ncbi:MAG TPA: hypothetical protein VLN49_10980 [Gemmatimonadaceae bacterium]|nr:hypothetical protein [Gemmatimonadaceae bacterium]
MRPILLYPKRRAIVRGLTLSAIAALTVGTVVACQGDQPVAPNRAAADTTASKALYRPGSGKIRWSLEDGSWSFLISPGTFQLSGGPANTTVNVTDNFAPDQDSTKGNFELTGLLPGTYTLCETLPPPKYLLPQPPMSPCQSVNVYSNTTTWMGPVFNMHIPIEAWSVVDPVGNLLGGAYFQLQDSTNTVIASSFDNGGFDTDNTPGKWLTELTVPGYYTLCEVLAPSGYVLPKIPCKKFYALGGITAQQLGSWVNTPNYSMYFNVTDPYGNPLSGTQFVIIRQYYPKSNINVTDNIFPDRDPKTGKYFVVLPASGWYVVCQTTAPYGYDIPTTNGGCYPIATNVQFGVPANAGTFVDKPWPVAR